MSYIRGKKKAILLTVALMVIGTAFFALPALAQVDLGLEQAADIGLTTTDIRTTIARIIRVFLGLLGFVAVLIVMYAGFLWMTAGGDAEKVERAKKWMINGVVGLIIILTSFAITSFILNAVTDSTGGGLGGDGSGCPPGQTCPIPPSGGGGFRVSTITPYGPGPGENGWPKNYAIVSSFNGDVAESTVSASTVRVWQCNPRIDGGGDPQPFDAGACDDLVSGTRAVDGNRISFKPDSSDEDDPTDFNGENWYMIRLSGIELTDTSGRILICPPTPVGDAGDISSTSVQRDLCDRAVAFNDLRDTEAPIVRINSPASSPAYCADRIAVVARAEDDFLPERVDFRIDGGVTGLVDGEYNPISSEANSELDNPFVTDDIFIQTNLLTPGNTYTLTATAWDPVPQSSDTREREFRIAFAHCCNGVIDEDLGETGIDCGGECGACDGEVCSEHSDCASGFCNPESGRCESRPVIESMSPSSAGPGSMVTISGQFFGSRQGVVVFLGDEEDDTDDVEVVACYPNAWNETEIVIQVPAGAPTGPLEVRTRNGATDNTNDDHGPVLGAFVVNTDIVPGICWLEPASGGPGDEVVIHGNGLGTPGDLNWVRMDGVTPTVSIGGWSETEIRIITPPTLSEGVYPVKVVLGALESNSVDYTLRLDSSADGPRIIEVTPDQGSPGTYVTVRGSGFGNGDGIVRFTRGEDVAFASEPLCDDNWHDNYVVVKVPESFEDGSDIEPIPAVYNITIETAPLSQISNSVPFTINTDPLAPGICSMSPNNGPPGISFVVNGEGFGDDWSLGPPEHSVRFYVNSTTTMQTELYSAWSETNVTGVVPGNLNDISTWPNTGPVRVIADNISSSNTIPFTVHDCNESGVCEEGLSCCSNGACQASCVPDSRDSAFGWWLSTDTLPSYPRVRKEVCELTPFINSDDGCLNAVISVPFTNMMEPASFVVNAVDPNDNTVSMIECGNGNTPSCPEEGGIAVPLVIDEPAMVTDMKILSPADSYNEGTGYFKRGYWYEVTLKSDPAAGIGITDTGGRYLDGDYDRKPGGNFSWDFRIDPDRDSCAVSSVDVVPDKYLVEHEGAPMSPEDGSFGAYPKSANCNMLRCEPGAGGYSIDWTQLSDPLDPALVLFDVIADECKQRVQGAFETPVEDPAELITLLEPDGDGPTVEGDSAITVNFADPMIVEAFPSDGCTEACVNGAVGAIFNVVMDSTTFTADNIRMYRCYNESCSAPFLPLDSPRILSSITEDNGDGEEVVGFMLEGDDLLAATYYIVRVEGGENGVLSDSQVPLSGLNADGWYEWSFRTRADVTECGVDHTEVSPAIATLYYVGQRLGLNAVPYSPPDACSSRGQRLTASSYDWIWEFGMPNTVLRDGFIRVTNDVDLDNPDASWDSDSGSRENTAPRPKSGCTSECLLVGAEPSVSQCGNSRVEAGEDCDPPGVGSGCSAECLWLGTESPTCGNGVIDPGENCDAFLDADSGENIFPPGCADPDEYERGCVWLGSDVSGSNCGNGIISDGEACDDGNRRDGDGCSSVCLNESTLLACNPALPGGMENCVSVCGDTIVQPGEDAGCELLGGVPADCSTNTCKKIGSEVSCGNGIVDAAEECDDNNTDDDDGCSSECLLEGSSIYHEAPSFCGDGFVGMGEHPQCEAGIDIGADIDPYQAVVTKNYDSGGGSPAMSVVGASTGGLADEDIGKSRVTLSCTCRNASDPDAHCSDDLGLGAGFGCASSGCCVPRPTVTTVIPSNAAQLSCRNVPVIVTFDALMDETSVKQNLFVGVDNYNYDEGRPEDCPEGTTALPEHVAVAPPAEEPGFFGRIWNSLASAFSRYIIRPVFGYPTATIELASAHNNYCTIEGSMVVSTSGTGDDMVSVATFYPRYGLPADSWVRVQLTDEAVSAEGVTSIKYASHFETPGVADICEVASVRISPDSYLFVSREEGLSSPFTAYASAADGSLISEVEGLYEWDWEWVPQPEVEPIFSPVVLEQVGETNIANVWVRGTRSSDVVPAEYQPADGEALLTATAVITRTLDGEITEEELRPRFNGYSDVYVMLCDNPWPEWRDCDGSGEAQLPWDESNPKECLGQSRVWSPFYDEWSNTEFYYCRDGSVAGDAAAVLPAIRMRNADDVVLLLRPAEGIFREYLFTFDNSGGPRSSVGEWGDDAIGFRIASNGSHIGVREWYAEQGFRGSPSPITVSGYDALQEGRTVYTNAAAVTNSGNIYTNINILSFNDSAATETVGVFNQILNRIDFNRNIQESSICQLRTTSLVTDDSPVESPLLIDDNVVPCLSDLECIKYQPEATSEYSYRTWCDSAKSKLGRDVTRWSDMQVMRQTLLRTALPMLVEGTFLRGRTYSAWPSWQATLGTDVSSVLPTDPLNNLADCPVVSTSDGQIEYDQNTCWSAEARQFRCGYASEIYGYSYAANNADLYADLEYSSPGVAWAKWSGETCLEKTDEGSCLATGGCTWLGTTCNYSRVRINLGGLQSTPDMCGVADIGADGICGDGVLNVSSGEICEIGDRQVVPCTGTVGTQEQICQAGGPNACLEWVNSGSCIEAYCGDGIVQPERLEICDDGELNGTYGKCSNNCFSFGPRCGDGEAYPGEACDCGAKNGQYLFNGVLAPIGTPDTSCEAPGSLDTSALGCAWDCSGPGPRCGDGVINGGEDCDGGFQESSGICSVTRSQACTSDDECPGSETCDSCPTSEQRWRRSCNTNNPTSRTDDYDQAVPEQAACKWSGWACTAPGSCGNGTTDTGEECDDGNDNNEDACTNSCDRNVCGDGYVNVGVEACDSGSRNNVPCIPEYGRSCNYCTSSCRLSTVTGGFCGDGIIQSPDAVPPVVTGPESCEPVTGLTGNWVCVSTKEENRSFGLQTGEPVCSGSNCVPACETLTAEPCFNDGPNNDRVGTWGLYPGERFEECSSVYFAGFETYGPEADALCQLGYFYTDPQGEQQVSDLADACDPDDDNDGVPDTHDCDPLDRNVHPAYHNAAAGITIPAAEEQCGPVDDNCNGTLLDLPPGQHYQVDMVFSIDITGSMNEQVSRLLGSIHAMAS
jgi:cysteine-rich repeat protein